MSDNSECNTPFSEYTRYNDELNKLVNNILQGSELVLSDQHKFALDGQAGTRLQKIASLRNRRESGAFFTTSALRKILIKNTPTSSNKIIYDPCCGAGDLLIEWSHYLPVAKTLEKTLTQWGHALRGIDIHVEFIETAKVRLVLAALARGCRFKYPLDTSQYFPYLKVGDCLTDLSGYEMADVVLLNPPFKYINTPERYRNWTSGKVSMAATVILDSIYKSRSGTRILAILPDVLRSGSRYKLWREILQTRVAINRWETFGQFAANIDIDVFLVNLLTRIPQADNPDFISIPTAPSNAVQDNPNNSIGDQFIVRVGPVVPHRHAEDGVSAPYIDSRSLPLSGFFLADEAPQRSYRCPSHFPPFVAIRRTSRPGTIRRASGVIVTGTKPVLVENHLILLKPINGTVQSCEDIVKFLDSDKARLWLDERIRCRHLTTTALSEMPISVHN